METNTELSIDVGGGSGDRFLKLARKNPGNSHLVLDPSIKNIPDNPKNLCLINWQSNTFSSLPIPDGSVDMASVAFLMGEIRTKERDDGSLDTAKKRYELLLMEHAQAKLEDKNYSKWADIFNQV